jgi:hypothetical protein
MLILQYFHCLVDFPVFSLFTKAGYVNEEHKHGTETVQKQ